MRSRNRGIVVGLALLCAGGVLAHADAPVLPTLKEQENCVKMSEYAYVIALGRQMGASLNAQLAADAMLGYSQEFQDFLRHTAGWVYGQSTTDPARVKNNFQLECFGQAIFRRRQP